MPPELPTGTPDPPLAGLGRFAWKVGVGTAIAIALAWAGLKLVAPGPGREPPGTAGDAPARPAPRDAAPAARRTPARLDAEVPPDVSVTLGDAAREVERRHAAGELSDAQRRLDACAGDRRRLAWLDGEGRVLRLARETAGGFAVVEWFDPEGRLREAVVSGTAGGRRWSRHVRLDASGAEQGLDTGDARLSPDAPEPPLVRTDPARAFFAGCDGAR